MDDLGLPISFGKPQQATSAAQNATSGAEASRGTHGGRGPRGVVGGGKNRRGRGRGQGRGGYPGRDIPAGDESQRTEGQKMNEGVKRPFPVSPPNQARDVPSTDTEAPAPGGHPGHGRSLQPAATSQFASNSGFYQPSFVEDPWRSLMEARKRR